MAWNLVFFWSVTTANRAQGEHAPEDVLADDLHVGRPAAREHRLAVGPGEPDGGEVHRQRVDPDVYRVRLVIRDGYPPREPRARPRDGEVLERGGP